IVFNSGELTASTVSAWCQLQLWSDGRVSFTAHAHESGAISHHYDIAMVIQGALPDPDVPNEKIPIIVEHMGIVHGTFDLGSRDDDWHAEAIDTAIRDHWAAVSSAPVPHTGLSVVTDVIDILSFIADFLVELGLPVDVPYRLLTM